MAFPFKKMYSEIEVNRPMVLNGVVTCGSGKR